MDSKSERLEERLNRRLAEKKKHQQSLMSDIAKIKSEIKSLEKHGKEQFGGNVKDVTDFLGTYIKAGLNVIPAIIMLLFLQSILPKQFHFIGYILFILGLISPFIVGIKKINKKQNHLELLEKQKEACGKLLNQMEQVESEINQIKITLCID